MSTKTSPLEFFRQVRAEMQKVTWATRKETTVSVIAVFVMVTLASLFLFVSDQIIAFVVKMILNIGG
jgi:preprotein translocase subunit SecE